MYLCYIDESGNTGSNLKDAHQPYLVLLTLLVPAQCVKNIENDLREIGYKYFGAESRNTDFEFHGDAIYNARKADRYFKKHPLEKRLILLDELVDVLLKYNEIKIGYVLSNKSRYFGNLHIQQMAFHLLVEKIEEHLNGHLNDYGLLIADEQDELEQKLIDDLDHFKQHGTTFGYKKVQIERIIDSVHFVQSHNNHLMQLADVLCYLVRKGEEINDTLLSAYLAIPDRSENYRLWLNEHATRGQKYFLGILDKIKAKGMLFSKEFPTK